MTALTWAIFDLNGTLVDPSVLAEPLDAPAELAVGAFADAIQLAMVTTLTGGRAAFRDLVESALRRRLALAGQDPDRAEAALERLPHMPAFPEAAAALARLRDGGVRIAVLTQSSAEAAEAVLAGAGLREAVDLVLSAPATGAFKPDARPYRMALERTGGPPAWFVAAHAWDVTGAARVGLRTAWVARTERVYPDVFPAPDVAGGDLEEAAGGILAAEGPAG